MQLLQCNRHTHNASVVHWCEIKNIGQIGRRRETGSERNERRREGEGGREKTSGMKNVQRKTIFFVTLLNNNQIVRVATESANRHMYVLLDSAQAVRAYIIMGSKRRQEQLMVFDFAVDQETVSG